jgi:hypothetical protein
MSNTVLQPVVMAGGSGTRLWPLSRAGVGAGEAITPPGVCPRVNHKLRFEDTYGRA